MKKLLLTTTFLGALIGITSAATIQVTLQFSSTTQYLSNFANGEGSAISSTGANRLVWGLLVDVNNNGFNGALDTSPYRGGFSLTAASDGLVTTTTSNGSNTVLSDDMLWIAGAVMASSTVASPPDSSLTNMNRVTSLTSMNLTDSMQGKPLAVIWFDSLTVGSTASTGMKYGVFNTGLLTPTTPGTIPLAGNFGGADSLKTMGFTLGTPIPETSTSLLGAIGALALLRRRRN